MFTNCIGCDGNGKVRIENKILPCPVCGGSGMLKSDKIAELPAKEVRKLPGARRFSHNTISVKCQCGNDDLLQTDKDAMFPPPSGGRRMHRVKYDLLCPECGKTGSAVDYEKSRFVGGKEVEHVDEIRVDGCIVKK